MEPISIPLNQLILVLGGWTVVLTGLLVWTGRILAERITSAWRQYENEKLETMKHGFTSDRVLLENAIRGAQQGLDSIQMRRLSAIEALWNSVLKLRADFTGSIFFYEMLSPEEYGEVIKRGDSMAASIRDRVALRKHPLQFFGSLVRIGGVTLFAPVIKPSIPIFSAHAWAARAKLVQFGELGFCVAAAKVDDCG